VTQTYNPPGHGTSLSTPARIAWLILILATLYICYFHALGVLGFVGPDEPRYAWIAREMEESGDWVTPRLYGKPWFEKPALYYWGAAISFKLFGVTEAAARLPSAFSALLCTLAIAWLAWRVYDAETARWLLLLLPTTVGMIGFSHAAATDMPFAGMLTIAMVFAAGILGLTRNENSPVLPRTPWLAPLLFGFFLGLAVLAKGPAAIVLSGGAILLWAVITKRRRDAFRCLHPVAIATFCLTALPWYILCARRNPDFFRVFFIEHNFKRYLTPEFQHIQPFWFYVPIVLIAFVPWTLPLLWSAISGSLWLWRKKNISQLTIFLLCWPAFCLLFFSASKSKLPGYILPAVPPIGLLLARSYVRLVPEFEKSFWCLLVTYASSVALFGLFLWQFFGSLQTTAEAGTSVGIAILLFALANLLLAARRRFYQMHLTPATLCVIPILLLLCFFSPISSAFRINNLYSGRTIATELAANHIPSDQLYYASMHSGQQYSLSFYLHHEIQGWDPENPKAGFLLIRSKSCGYFVKAPWVCNENPIRLESSGWFVYRVDRGDSVSEFSSLDGSGLDLGGSGVDGTNRQSR
jgi:4-amino-4-deoxy-L-arabinose transferase-like glycosyltransferase